MKGFGLILLLAGFAMIAYAFQPSDSVSLTMSHAHASIPSFKILWLLVSGSGATVVGFTMMLSRWGRLQK